MCYEGREKFGVSNGLFYNGSEEWVGAREYTEDHVVNIFGVLSRKVNPGLLFEIGNRSGVIPA